MVSNATYSRDQYLRGQLDGTAASQEIAELRDWPASALGIDGCWSGRSNCGIRCRGWGAFYVALVEIFDSTLLTTDERLVCPHGPTCRIEVLGAPADCRRL